MTIRPAAPPCERGGGLFCARVTCGDLRTDVAQALAGDLALKRYETLTGKGGPASLDHAVTGRLGQRKRERL